MIVYGSLQSEASLHSLVKKLWGHANPKTVDDWRTLLIEAGQLEQAVADRQTASEGLSSLMKLAGQLTDQAAAGFVACWSEQAEESGRFKSIHCCLNLLQKAADLRLFITTPEGYSFYALFPEQYCAAALTWMKHRSEQQSKSATVIGIRSIGTSLSAVVAATLQSAGCPAERFTVRPFGRPFQRQVEFSISPEQKAGSFLIVDEGPGISGSSMVAVAKALTEQGVCDIAFLPGHGGSPGAKASEVIRECWRSTPRYVGSLEEVCWKEGSLWQSLTTQTQELLGISGPFAMNDLSGGLWRRCAYTDEQHWPAVAAQFERMKLLCTDSHGHSVLWKFAELADLNGRGSAEAALSRLCRLGKLGFTSTPLGSFRGFVATPWIEGRRLTELDAEVQEVLHHLAQHLIASRLDPLSIAEHCAGIARLREMLYWNTRESLGCDFAEYAHSVGEVLGEEECPRCYGDGHLAPHEWVRTASGVILKTDCEGHDADHTIIGKQSALWDLAGVLVEWNLNERNAGRLLHLLEQGGYGFSDESLRFYRAAYSGFRLGVFTLAESQTADAAEQARLRRAQRFYKHQLRTLLNGESVPLPAQAHYGANSQ